MLIHAWQSSAHATCSLITIVANSIPWLAFCLSVLQPSLLACVLDAAAAHFVHAAPLSLRRVLI
jgi:hypothetical protein